MNPLVTADWLEQRLGDPDLVVVDVRWRLNEPGAGRREYLDSHVAGAVFLDVDTDLSSPPGPAGRHPLPDPSAFQAAARAAGISGGSTVVGYDNGMGGAARLWWLLRHFGHEDARILDGGFAGYDGPTESGEPTAPPPPGDFTATPRPGDIAALDELKTTGDRLLLIDARAPERYRGEVEPIDPVAGHIPGAVNVPFAELAPGGRFAPREQIAEKLKIVGPDTVAYCGSGITASVLIAAAEAAGIEGIRLYPGSWSEWSQTIEGSRRQD